VIRYDTFYFFNLFYSNITAHTVQHTQYSRAEHSRALTASESSTVPAPCALRSCLKGQDMEGEGGRKVREKQKGVGGEENKRGIERKDGGGRERVNDRRGRSNGEGRGMSRDRGSPFTRWG
jgi:hypothetical protein